MYTRQQLIIEQEPHCTLRVSRWDLSRQGKGRISATPPDGTGETSDKDTGARLALSLIEGVYHDRDRGHAGLWVKSVHRLMLARKRIPRPPQDMLDKARHYPALLALRAAGIASLVADRDDVLLRLLTEPTWRDPVSSKLTPAVLALGEYTVVSEGAVNALPRWSGHRWLYAPSHLLRADLRDVLRPILPDDDDYQWASDRYEYHVALTQYHLQSRPAGYAQCASGEFIGRQQLAEGDFRTAAGQAGDDWPWWQVVGGPAGMEAILTGLSQELARIARTS